MYTRERGERIKKEARGWYYMAFGLEGSCIFDESGRLALGR